MTRRLLALVPRRQAGYRRPDRSKFLPVNRNPRSSSATGPVSPPKDPAEGVGVGLVTATAPASFGWCFSAVAVVAASGSRCRPVRSHADSITFAERVGAGHPGDRVRSTAIRRWPPGNRPARSARRHAGLMLALWWNTLPGS
jgi:hypothetical protein